MDGTKWIERNWFDLNSLRDVDRMRIETGFKIIVWVERSCRMTERMSHIRNYYKLSVCAFAMAGRWMAGVTHTLVSVWGQANVHSQLDGVVWNRTICKRLSITERGSDVE